MVKKRLSSFKKLKKIKGEESNNSMMREILEEGSGRSRTPRGCFAVYVGEECRRFVVPTRFLTHPLLKMVLDKAYKEFGFNQKNALILPCTVFAFQQIITFVQSNNPSFHFGEFVQEFL